MQGQVEREARVFILTLVLAVPVESYCFRHLTPFRVPAFSRLQYFHFIPLAASVSNGFLLLLVPGCFMSFVVPPVAYFLKIIPH